MDVDRMRMWAQVGGTEWITPREATRRATRICRQILEAGVPSLRAVTICVPRLIRSRSSSEAFVTEPESVLVAAEFQPESWAIAIEAIEELGRVSSRTPCLVAVAVKLVGSTAEFRVEAGSVCLVGETRVPVTARHDMTAAFTPSEAAP